MIGKKYEDILKAYPPRRENLVTAFQDIQEKDGYISENALESTAEYFGISKADAYSIFTRWQVFMLSLNLKSQEGTL